MPIHPLAAYRATLNPFAAQVEQLAQSLLLTNGMRFLGGFRAMVVQAALSDDPRRGLEVKGDYDPDAFATSANVREAISTPSVEPVRGTSQGDVPISVDARFDRPIIILSPPRSGSTLLFETLLRTRDVYTVGGESHIQIEGMQELHPAARNFHSNALGAGIAREGVAARLRSRFAMALRDRNGNHTPGAAS